MNGLYGLHVGQAFPYTVTDTVSAQSQTRANAKVSACRACSLLTSGALNLAILLQNDVSVEVASEETVSFRKDGSLRGHGPKWNEDAVVVTARSDRY